ncbi:MAG: hypothetical protein AAGN66_21115 [Acidobacteriota bacterium]
MKRPQTIAPTYVDDWFVLVRLTLAGGLGTFVSSSGVYVLGLKADASQWQEKLLVVCLAAMAFAFLGLLGIGSIGLAFLGLRLVSDQSPGRFLEMLSSFSSDRIRCDVFEPVVRDLIDERLDALAEFEATGRRFYLWKARWVVVRGYGSFGNAALAQITLSCARWLLRLRKAG